MALKSGGMGFLILILMVFLCSSDAHTLTVDWSLHPSEKYNHWAERNRFTINDQLVFKYKQGHDSVLVVNRKDYKKCNKENPIKKLGNDSIFKIEKSGALFFISGHNQNCEKGQKLNLIVLSDQHHHHNNNTNTPSASSPTPSHVSPAPSQYSPASTPPPMSKTPSPAPTQSPAAKAPISANSPTHHAPVSHHSPSEAPTPSPAAKAPMSHDHSPSEAPTPSPAAKAPVSHDHSPSEAPSHVKQPSPSPTAKAPSSNPATTHAPSPSPTTTLKAPTHAAPPVQPPSPVSHHSQSILTESPKQNEQHAPAHQVAYRYAPAPAPSAASDICRVSSFARQLVGFGVVAIVVMISVV